MSMLVESRYRAGQGEVAVVTGGAQGMGRSIALTFARAGYDVVIVDLNEEGANATAQEVKDLGRAVLVIQVDVTRQRDVRRMVQDVVAKFGKIDVLVNNAGILERAPFLEVSEANLDRTLAVNVKGCFLCSQEVSRVMAANRSGKIVSIASISGEAASHHNAAYAASKGGVIALTRSMAVELARHNINVNAVAPGAMETPMNTELPAEVRAHVIKRTPLRRFGDPQDVANAVLFLASDAASFITGQTLTVDGGATASNVY